MNEEIILLKSIHAALNQLETKGKQNCSIVVACMNDIEKVVTALEKPKTDKPKTEKEAAK